MSLVMVILSFIRLMKMDEDSDTRAEGTNVTMPFRNEARVVSTSDASERVPEADDLSDEAQLFSGEEDTRGKDDDVPVNQGSALEDPEHAEDQDDRIRDRGELIGPGYSLSIGDQGNDLSNILTHPVSGASNTPRQPETIIESTASSYPSFTPVFRAGPTLSHHQDDASFFDDVIDRTLDDGNQEDRLNENMDDGSSDINHDVQVTARAQASAPAGSPIVHTPSQGSSEDDQTSGAQHLFAEDVDFLATLGSEPETLSDDPSTETHRADIKAGNNTSASDVMLSAHETREVALETAADGPFTNASNFFGDDDDFLLSSISGQAPTSSDWTPTFDVDQEVTHANNMRLEESDEVPGSVDEVPEGWYGEDGEWNWYTAEERELVRESMVVEQQRSKASTINTEAYQWNPASPSIVSESDARRTPVPNELMHEVAPLESVQDDEDDIFDRYAPKSARPAVHTLHPPWPASNTTPDVLPEAIASPSMHSTKSRLAAPSAYDPPQLRSQKSFVRPTAPSFATPNASLAAASWVQPTSATSIQTDSTHQGDVLLQSPLPLAPPPQPKSYRSVNFREATTKAVVPQHPEMSTVGGVRRTDSKDLEDLHTPAKLEDRSYSPEPSNSTAYEPALDSRRLQTTPHSDYALPAAFSPDPTLRNVEASPATADAIPNYARQTSNFVPGIPEKSTRGYSPLQHDYAEQLFDENESEYRLDEPVGVNVDAAYVPTSHGLDLAVDEEPLSRQGLSSRRKPLFTFGFGGVVAMSFPAVEVSMSPNSTLADLSTGYGYGSLRARISLRTIGDVLPLSAVKTSDIVFPGPLCGEGIVNRAADKSTKQRRGMVMDYLTSRIDESTKALTFLSNTSTNSTRRDESSRLVAWRVLQVLVSHNGTIPTTGVEASDLREALRLPLNPSQTIGHLDQGMVKQTSAPSDHETMRLLGPLMSSGQLADALEIAIQRGAWAHALLIASNRGEVTWRRTTEAFEESIFADGTLEPGLRSTYTVLSGRSEDLVNRLCSHGNKNDTAFDNWERDVAALVEHSKQGEQDALLRLGRHFSNLGMFSAAVTCLVCSSELLRWGEGSFDCALFDQSSRSDFEDHVIMLEIAEFALALRRTTSKVRDLASHTNLGYATFLAAKLSRVFTLTERGQLDNAQRYCKAVLGSQRSDLPSYLAANIQDLSDRLAGDISATGLSLHSKGSKSAKLGSWVQGRFTKFIAGEEETSAPNPGSSDGNGVPSGPVGPFSHWSAIAPMPEGQHAAVGEAAYGSAFSDGRSVDDIPSSLVAAARDAYRPDTYAEQETPRASPPSQYEQLRVVQEQASTQPSGYGDEDEDDLGLGNYSSRPITPRAAQQETHDDHAAQKAAPPKAAEAPPNPKGSWLGRLWGKKEGEGAGPVRAKLGDESSMIFDPELKRWIVKGAKPDAPPPSAAPPPRAQTASPAHRVASAVSTPPLRSSLTNPPSISTTPKPDEHAARLPTPDAGSATDGPPTKPPNRAGAGPLAGSAIDDLLTRPPSKRPGSAAAKKNIRKRYVDVLQPDA